MKKWFFITCFLLVMVLAARSNPVDLRLARTVGAQFLKANTTMGVASEQDLTWVTTYHTRKGDTAFHIFNLPDGFVIVSADDCATPILGYATTGRFCEGDLPPAMEAYLQGFMEQIEYSVENHLEANEHTARQWELVRTTGLLNDNRDGEAVEPLLTTMWGQGCYYNAMCPEDPNGYCGGHVPTGCAATAMGMIMHYWGHPSQGSGTHTYTPSGYPQQSVNFGETTYDWANMPDRLTEASTQEEIDAVSTLLWHCGVSVNTRYGSLNSTAFADLIPDALMDRFNYSDEIFFPSDIVYDENLSLWFTMIKDELFLGRPILYLGANPSDGHAWVCDGIDSQDLLHFNWGWDGQNNGYYSLYAGIGYAMQSAIFGIVPEGDYGVTTQTIPLAQGWNWWSTNIEVTLAQLEEALGADGMTIIAQDGGAVTNSSYGWGGDPITLEVGKMYKIQPSSSCMLTLSGLIPDPSTHPVTLMPGSNWIGFVGSEAMALDVALSNLTPSNLDNIRTANGSATYYQGIGWRGSISSLEPGRGYVYKSNASGGMTFTFPIVAK